MTNEQGSDSGKDGEVLQKEGGYLVISTDKVFFTFYTYCDLFG